ncbi:MAG: fructose-6-phosphate aldolase [Ruminiclostridium sp.]|nr:fructose-6-phosphate aldolase [Ruminiclostridium sp.]
MQIFLDTANLQEISKGIEGGCISGVTTNPTIISKENKPLQKCIRDISALDPDLTILVEVVSLEAKDMINEARQLSRLANNIIVKIPMTSQGLASVRILSQENIRTAVTLVFSCNQAIAASCAGADYIAPFVGRLDDINADGLNLIKSIKKVFTIQNAGTKIISASIRTPQSVAELFISGSDIVTVPGNILQAMYKHPLTDSGLQKFSEDWCKVPKEL